MRLQDFKHVAQILGLYVTSTALDFVSSVRNIPGHPETNVFARHADGAFWLKHALINFGFVTAEYGLISAMFYVAAKPLGPRLRSFVTALPFLYMAYGHLNAAVGNFELMWPGLYVQTYQEAFRNLMGY